MGSSPAGIEFEAQICRQHDAFPFYQSELLLCPIVNSSLIKWFNIDPHEWAVEVGYSVGRCGADRFTCLLVFLSGSPTSLGPSMPFKYPCMVHMLSSPNTSPIIVRVSIALFSRFALTLMLTGCSFVRSITKSHQARYTTPNKRM